MVKTTTGYLQQQQQQKLRTETKKTAIQTFCTVPISPL